HQSKEARHACCAPTVTLLRRGPPRPPLPYGRAELAAAQPLVVARTPAAYVLLDHNNLSTARGHERRGPLAGVDSRGGRGLDGLGTGGPTRRRRVGAGWDSSWCSWLPSARGALWLTCMRRW